MTDNEIKNLIAANQIVIITKVFDTLNIIIDKLLNMSVKADIEGRCMRKLTEREILESLSETLKELSSQMLKDIKK